MLYNRFLSTALALALTVGIASAMTIRDDVADSSYTALGNQFESVGSFYSSSTGEFASGVLIAPDWVLTAAHVGAQAGFEFRIGTGSFVTSPIYGVQQGYIDPLYNSSTLEHDLELVHLSSSISGISTVSLWGGTVDPGQLVTSVGFGYTGNGINGASAGTAGTRRGIEQTIRAVNFNSTQTGLLPGYIADFRSPHSNTDTLASVGITPDPTPRALEGSDAPGDSGGGLFTSIGGYSNVQIGTVSYGVYLTNGKEAAYGDIMGWSMYEQSDLDWIKATSGVQAVPEPSAFDALGLGLLGLLSRRRRN